jgi:hypothetical protein
MSRYFQTWAIYKHADYLTNKLTASARAIRHCNWRVVFVELLLICAWRSFDLAGWVRCHFAGRATMYKLGGCTF